MLFLSVHSWNSSRGKSNSGAARSLDDYLDTFDSEGGSTEGISYWDFGFANYVLAGHLIYHRTNGRVDFFADKRSCKAIMFPLRTMLSPNRFANFSDCDEDTVLAAPTATRTPTLTPSLTPTHTPTLTSTPTPSPTATPGISVYPLGSGLPAPGRLQYPYQGVSCVEGSTALNDRIACGILGYNAALDRLGGSMTWDTFIALTIQGEANAIYGVTDNANCHPVSCQDVRDTFERAAIRNLARVCGGDGNCTSQEILTYLGETQIWYNPGRNTGVADPTDLERLFGGGHYTAYSGVLSRWWSDPTVNTGDINYSNSWGNCRVDLRNSGYRPPDALRWMYYRDANSSYYIHEPNPLPGEVIFIVGSHQPCNF